MKLVLLVLFVIVASICNGLQCYMGLSDRGRECSVLTTCNIKNCSKGEVCKTESTWTGLVFSCSNISECESFDEGKYESLDWAESSCCNKTNLCNNPKKWMDSKTHETTPLISTAVTAREDWCEHDITVCFDPRTSKPYIVCSDKPYCLRVTFLDGTDGDWTNNFNQTNEQIKVTPEKLRKTIHKVCSDVTWRAIKDKRKHAHYCSPGYMHYYENDNTVVLKDVFFCCCKYNRPLDMANFNIAEDDCFLNEDFIPHAKDAAFNFSNWMKDEYRRNYYQANKNSKCHTTDGSVVHNDYRIKNCVMVVRADNIDFSESAGPMHISTITAANFEAKELAARSSIQLCRPTEYQDKEFMKDDWCAITRTLKTFDILCCCNEETCNLEKLENVCAVSKILYIDVNGNSKIEGKRLEEPHKMKLSDIHNEGLLPSGKIWLEYGGYSRCGQDLTMIYKTKSNWKFTVDRYASSNQKECDVGQFNGRRFACSPKRDISTSSDPYAPVISCPFELAQIKLEEYKISQTCCCINGALCNQHTDEFNDFQRKALAEIPNCKFGRIPGKDTTFLTNIICWKALDMVSMQEVELLPGDNIDLYNNRDGFCEIDSCKWLDVQAEEKARTCKTGRNFTKDPWTVFICCCDSNLKENCNLDIDIYKKFVSWTKTRCLRSNTNWKDGIYSGALAWENNMTTEISNTTAWCYDRFETKNDSKTGQILSKWTGGIFDLAAKIQHSNFPCAKKRDRMPCATISSSENASVTLCCCEASQTDTRPCNDVYLNAQTAYLEHVFSKKSIVLKKSSCLNLKGASVTCTMPGCFASYEDINKRRNAGCIKDLTDIDPTKVAFVICSEVVKSGIPSCFMLPNSALFVCCCRASGACKDPIQTSINYYDKLTSDRTKLRHSGLILLFVIFISFFFVSPE